MVASLGGPLLAALFFFSLLGCALYLWFYWTHRRLLRTAASIPLVLPAWPLIGHAYIVFGGIAEMTRTVLTMVGEGVKARLKTSVFWCGPLPLICVVDPEDIQMVLSNSGTAEKAKEYDFFIELLSAKDDQHHLLFAPNSVWRKTRRHINPMFHPRNLQHMEPTFNRNSRLLVECLGKHLGKGEFDINHHTMNIGLLTICNLMFGPQVQIDIKSTAFKNLMKFVERVPDLFIKKLLLPWLRIDFLFKMLYRNELKQMACWWKGFTEASIQVTKNYKRKEIIKPGNLNSQCSDVEIEEKGQFSTDRLNLVDVYTVIQQLYPEFDENNMAADIGGFYCTGSDTIGVGVSSCLLALAQYPNIQERLYQEVSSEMKEDRDITPEDLTKMPYLDQVIKETLRFFMIVPFVLRRPTKDIQLSDCIVPADSTLLVPLAAIHMDPNIYPNPTSFDPDRFSPDISPEKKRFAYVPFSAGPRNCVAKVYAMQLMKIMVVHVLKRFKLFTKMDIHKLNRRLVITLVSEDGYLVTVQNR